MILITIIITFCGAERYFEDVGLHNVAVKRRQGGGAELAYDDTTAP